MVTASCDIADLNNAGRAGWLLHVVQIRLMPHLAPLPIRPSANYNRTRNSGRLNPFMFNRPLQET